VFPVRCELGSLNAVSVTLRLNLYFGPFNIRDVMQ
jgi:hypothetical protein